MAESRSVVIVALAANGAIAVLKFFASLASGSHSVLSEAYHSLSGVGNQLFLPIGIGYSDRAATRTHPFGVAGVDSLRSMFVGPQTVPVTVDVSFDDDDLDTTTRSTRPRRHYGPSTTACRSTTSSRRG